MSARDYGTIVLVGGGCYGSYYVRQLERARNAGAVRYESLAVVDRDPDCAVAKQNPTTSVVVAEWSDFFDSYLGAANDTSADAIVPSPLMPHLMYEWLLRRARERWPERLVETRPLETELAVPWRSDAPDATTYVSHATWMCPINCIEPATCPHTRGERSWTMPASAADAVAQARSAGKSLAGPVIFHCTHRVYGVGMFDTRDVVAGDRFIATAGAHEAVDVLVGTVSHCHGALNVLHVGT